MKNLFVIALATIALASCSKTENTNEIINTKDASSVTISFKEAEAETKAFFGTTAAAETWEKTLSEVTIIVFNQTGNALVQRQFTAAEITSKAATFVVPNAVAGDNCEFYAVANIPIATVANKTALLALMESSAAVYNGTFADVSTKTKRVNGFVMSGNVTKALATSGTATSVAITLKRTVAKVAIEATQSPEFANRYNGAVKVNSAKLVKGASQSLIIKPTAPSTGAMTFTHTQPSNVASDKSQNLFYLFENGSLAVGNRVAIELNATYDADGNFTTTTDQTPMVYTVELEGTTAGTIVRNGYYRIQVAITGLTGNDAAVSITVADWETPVTQSVSVGQ